MSKWPYAELNLLQFRYFDISIKLTIQLCSELHQLQWLSGCRGKFWCETSPPHTRGRGKCSLWWRKYSCECPFRDFVCNAFIILTLTNQCGINSNRCKFGYLVHHQRFEWWYHSMSEVSEIKSREVNPKMKFMEINHLQIKLEDHQKRGILAHFFF